MTPIEAIQEKFTKAKESGKINRLIRNIGWGVAGLTVIALFVVGLVFVINFLYAIIGLWAALIGAIILLGTVIGVVTTFLE